MVVTKHIEIPSDEELTVPELNISTPALRAGAFHLGKHCEQANNEFMLCRKENSDPRKCLNEGKQVTNCALDFFRQVKANCLEEFMQYANCLDQSSSELKFSLCRTTQGIYDSCVANKLHITRPDYGYFCRAKIHETDRPAPEIKPKKSYPDATPGLPDDYPRPEAKYGQRYLWVE